ncbi:hypothetical protein, partial [Streptomyces sp. Isolate_219]|uniref:hypothetical protein n=1 Tax=Streptomyces sp. Isolate_219 TaxID=2950110 RepID=UPI0021C7F2B8
MPPAPPTAAGTTSHTTPVHPPLGEQAITVVLPADFAAFCQLHHEIYQHFAQQLLADHDTATDAVQRALGVLGHDFGDSRLIGGWPSSAVCRRRV